MKWPSGLRRCFKAPAIGMRGFESRSVRILLSKISVEPIGLEASAAGVVTGFPKRDNIFEGNPPERITPRNRTPTRAAGCWTPSGSSVTSDSLIKLFHYVSVSPTLLRVLRKNNYVIEVSEACLTYLFL